jgi:hypothetical protein
MRFTKSFKSLAILIIISALGFACSDSGNDSSGETATIEGQVSQSNEKAVSANSVVTAAYINAAGSIEPIEGTDVNTSASGSFELEVDAESYQNIVVMTEGEAESTYGFVSGELQNGSTYTIKPINAESSAETMVYAELASSGDDEMVTKAEVEAAVNAEAASMINSSSSATSEIAASLVASAEVRTNYIADRFEAEADTKMQMIADAMIEAQTDLEAQLDAATSAEARAQAYTEFRTDVNEAFTSAEIEASTTAKIIEMWGRVFINSSSEISSDIRNEVYTELSLMTATSLDIALQGEAESTDEATQSAIVDAGATLMTNIEASSGAEAEIRAAFETYSEDVQTALENDSNFSASVVVAINSEINSSEGAKTIFESAIDATVTSSIVIDAYQSFFTSIESTVESNASLDQAELEALTEMMILINLAS